MTSEPQSKTEKRSLGPNDRLSDRHLLAFGKRLGEKFGHAAVAGPDTDHDGREAAVLRARPNARWLPHHLVGRCGRGFLGQRAARRFESEGWSTATIDGRNHEEIRTALTQSHPGVPHVVVAKVEAK